VISKRLEIPGKLITIGMSNAILRSEQEKRVMSSEPKEDNLKKRR
jgi:hypothetical protein